MRRLAWPEDTHGWGAAVIGVAFVVHLVRYILFQHEDAHTYGDGYYTWLFARSLAYDGDVDLTNDYALCGDPWRLGTQEGGVYPANPFYFGPSVLMAPVLLLMRLVVRLKPDAPLVWKSGCSGPVLGYTGAFSAVALAITLWLAYRVARRWYSEKASALAVAVLAFASPFNVFATLTWYYSHLWAALAVALAVLMMVRADERPEDARRWLTAGAAVGLAGLMRTQEAAWGVVALASVASHWRAERTAAPTAKRLVALAAGFVAVFGIQLYVFQKLYGSPFVVPQGKLYVQLGHAHPWLALFSARSGFTYWTPLLWLSLFGLPLLVLDGRRRVLASAIVVVMALEHYVASAAISWTGSGTMGARVQTSLAVGLLLAAAASLEGILRWTRRRRVAALAVVSLAMLPTLLDTWFIPTSGVANDRPVPAPQLYGNAYINGWKWIYDGIGNPWTLPATAVFKLRYGAPPQAFDALATEGIFRRHYKTLGPAQDDTLLFASPPATYWATGFDSAPGGVAVRPGTGPRFLVTLYWPFVSRVRIHAKPLGDAPATLRVRTSSFFVGRDVGTLAFSRDETLDLPTSPSAFDSGIDEVLLDSDAPLALISMQFVDDLPHDTSVRVFGGH